MKNINIVLIIIVPLLIVALAISGFLIFNSQTPKRLNPKLDKTIDLNFNLQIDYNDSWDVTNENENGLTLSNDDEVSILITMSKAPEGSSLQEIVDANIEKLSTSMTATILDKDINGIKFKRVYFTGKDESSFPTYGLEAYTALLDDNILLVATIGYPRTINPDEAISIVNTIRLH
jgi:hypothetical protein